MQTLHRISFIRKDTIRSKPTHIKQEDNLETGTSLMSNESSVVISKFSKREQVKQKTPLSIISNKSMNRPITMVHEKIEEFSPEIESPIFVRKAR